MKMIPLTQGKMALVDDDNFERLSKFKWNVDKGHKTFYAKRFIWDGERNHKIYMHREIVGFPVGLQVDHRNGNGLDNQRENLRSATSSQNHANSDKKRIVSPFKGVTRDDARWVARVRHKVVGRFGTALEAALAYDKEAKRVFGEFAKPNFQ